MRPGLLFGIGTFCDASICINPTGLLLLPLIGTVADHAINRRNRGSNDSS